MSEHIQTPIQDDEITLKDLILKIKGYYAEIKKRWYVPAFCVVLLTALMLYLAFTTKPIYSAELTYMVNEADKAGMGGLGSLLGSFGVGTVGKTSMDMISELAKSERIMNTALFSKAKIDGVDDYFANHFIRIYEKQKGWQKDTTGLNGFTFKRGDFEMFTRLENKALNSIHGLLIGKTGKFGASFGKQTGILKLTFESPSEELTIYFTRSVFAHLGDFYVNTTTERERTNYMTLKAQQDSIFSIMKNKGQSAAAFQDYNRGLLLSGDAFKGQMMRRESEVAGAVYGELMKQFAVADYALRNNTPFISVIDLPKEPIEPIKKSKKMAVIIGFIGGIFLGSLIVIVRRIYLNAVA